MEIVKDYIQIKDLEVYKLAKKLSAIGWVMYDSFDWQTKKIMGDQFIESTDSVGANIVEGYKRYHFLDKIKFYYNARASLAECSEHWVELLYERKKIKEEAYKEYKAVAASLSIKLSNFISSTYKAKTEGS